MIKIVFKYILYRLFAPHRKGFGVHSPFVFDLVTRVINQNDDAVLSGIYSWRNKIIKKRDYLETSDIGAGSKTHRDGRRSIRQIVQKSSIRHKYGRVLYFLVKEYRPLEIIEMGTGIGISTAYLAKGYPESHVISLELDKEKLAFAGNALLQIEIENVSLKNGSFSELLPGILEKTGHPLLVFIDGDHRYDKTLEYFNLFKNHANPDTILVFDDIRWSEDMEKAWRSIKADPFTILSIDLFFIGIVFFRGGITKQDFVINF